MRLASRTTNPSTQGREDSVVFAVDAVVADQRIGHADDLPGVGRIGEHFLITGHRRVEDHLAGASPSRP